MYRFGPKDFDICTSVKCFLDAGINCMVVRRILKEFRRQFPIFYEMETVVQSFPSRPPYSGEYGGITLL